MGDRGRSVPFPTHPLYFVSRDCITCLSAEGTKGYNCLVPCTRSPLPGMMTTGSHHTAGQEGLAFPRDGEEKVRLNIAGTRGHQRTRCPLPSSLCHTAQRANTPPQDRALLAGSDGRDGLRCPFFSRFPHCQPSTLSSRGTNGVP